MKARILMLKFYVKTTLEFLLGQNDQLVTDAKEKAEVFRNQYFTDEDLTVMPEVIENEVSSTIPLITFSVSGIEHQLNILNIHKASGSSPLPFIT